jgi:2-phosphosulfolactate phosphatase
MRAGHVLLAGERDGRPLPGFDVGNSPQAFTACRCKGQTLVLTTTNGTRALVQCRHAARILVAAFVNYSAVCEQIRLDPRPIHIVCAGNDGEVALEDTLLAGAIVDFLCEHLDVELNDGARVAWDCFENHGRVLEGALQVSAGGVLLASLGYDEDICAAARVDRFALVPEMRTNPLRIEVGSVGITKSYWVK